MWLSRHGTAEWLLLEDWRTGGRTTNGPNGSKLQIFAVSRNEAILEVVSHSRCWRRSALSLSEMPATAGNEDQSEVR